MWLTWLACRSEAPPAPVTAAPPPAAPAPPRLVVLLVVDQLPIRLYDRALPLATGGLARLATGYRGVARHRHLATETAPGHAAIATGAAPERHGIVSNRWFEGGAFVYGGEVERLLADTLADRVTDAGGRAVAISLKDRAAILLGGHHPTGTAWLDVTGAGELRGAPLEPLGLPPLPTCTGPRSWTVVDEAHATAYGALFPDDQPFERADPPTFPHSTPCGDPRAWMGSPEAGTWLVDAAMAASDRLLLGQSDRPDLLMVSFSHVDVIGHAFTPDSWEGMDAMARLDLDLGRLLDHLDGTVGAGRYSVALTSDHGAPAGNPSRLPASLVADAIAGARAAGLTADPVFDEPWWWLPPGTPDAARGPALDAIRSAFAGAPGVIAVVDPGEPGELPAPLAEAVRLGAYPGRSGDLAVLRADGWQWEVRVGDQLEPRGVTHGSTDPLDQTVPLVLWGAGVKPGSGAELDVRQLAPTLARLLQVDRPQHAQVGPVAEALE